LSSHPGLKAGAINIETRREQIKRAFAHSEKKIDELVYQLYGLTKEEINIRTTMKFSKIKM
jgi:hypothetical protein